MMRTLRGLLAVGVAGTVLFGTSFPAAAAPFPQSPTHPDYSELWANPVVRVGEKDAEETLTAELVEVTPFTSDGSVSATVRLTNRSSEPITQASITARRAGAVATVAEARRALAQDVGAYTTVGETTALEDLAPGESAEVTLTYEAENPLSLNFTGTYPLLFAISGQAITPEGARLISTSERTLIRVEAGASDAPTDASPDAAVPEVSLLLSVDGAHLHHARRDRRSPRRPAPSPPKRKLQRATFPRWAPLRTPRRLRGCTHRAGGRGHVPGRRSRHRVHGVPHG